jgi:polyvinyl alcohol dehydrogenase (cytochrome)
MKSLMGSKGVLALLLVIITAGSFIVFPVQHVASAASLVPGDWPTYLVGPGRSGFNKDETIINPTTVSNLKVHWTRTVSTAISVEPVEMQSSGMVYWGSWDGIEHASHIADGTDVWTASLGTLTASCSHNPHGVTDTAVVNSVLIGGVKTLVVFVGGGNNTFYALNALTGKVLWHTLLGSQLGDFIWSSAVVYKNSVYVGEGSFGDCPLIRGKVVQLNASTGTIQHTFYTAPKGCVGATVWSSPTIDVQSNVLYVSTGNEGTCSTSEPLADALLALSTTDLSLEGAWQIPSSQQITDGDFGTAPTLFQATIAGVQHQMLGLINKNGMYYAFDRTNITAGPVWQTQLAVPPSGGGIGNNISSSEWDGTTLYAAAGVTTINGTSCSGSVRALDPASGAFLWQNCLSHDAIAPVIGCPGLVTVDAGQTLLILNASTGSQLFSFTDTHTKSMFAGPASISHGTLYQGNMDGILYAFGT